MMKTAILIDTENVGRGGVDFVFSKMEIPGEVAIKRAYGNYTSLCMIHDLSVQYGLDLKCVFPLVSGKNRTDSCIIIDTMDLLYRSDIDTFVIVTSDSDFTGLVQRLKESGKTVIGVGNKNTVLSLISACDKFYHYDTKEEAETVMVKPTAVKTIAPKAKVKKVVKQEPANFEPVSTSKAISPQLKRTIINAIKLGTNNLSAIKGVVSKKYPSFNSKEYGFSKFSSFVGSIDGVELYANGSEARIKNYPPCCEIGDALDSLYSICQENGKTLEVSRLSSEMRKKLQGFKFNLYNVVSAKDFVSRFVATDRRFSISNGLIRI